MRHDAPMRLHAAPLQQLVTKPPPWQHRATRTSLSTAPAAAGAAAGAATGAAAGLMSGMPEGRPGATAAAAGAAGAAGAVGAAGAAGRPLVGMPEDRRRTLDASWTHASRLYLRELAPRFLPWLVDGVKQLLESGPALPEGLPVLLPCCGPGHEIPLVYRCLRGRHPVIGSDLAAGMVRLSHGAVRSELAGQLWPNQAPLPSSSCTAGTLPSWSQAGGAQLDPELVDVLSNVLKAAAQQLGTDLLQPVPVVVQSPSSSGMHAGGTPMLSAEQADACLLDHAHGGQAAAVLSVFGLQQLGPLAPEALAAWVRCLAPGGRLVVVLWPSSVDQEGGPWWAYDQASKQLLAQQQTTAPGKPPQPPAQPPPHPPPQPQQPPSAPTRAQAGSSDTTTATTTSTNTITATATTTITTTAGAASAGYPWEQHLTAQAEQVSGCKLVLDQLVTHTMTWPDDQLFWEVMTQGGPWHARRLTSGDVFMDQLHALWLQALLSVPAAAVSAASGQGAACNAPAFVPVSAGPTKQAGLGDREGAGGAALSDGSAGVMATGNQAGSGEGTSSSSPADGSAGVVATGRSLAPLVHAPAARLIVLQRQAGGAEAGVRQLGGSVTAARL